MKALLLSALILATGSVFAQVKEFGSATCTLTNAGVSKTVSFKVASSMIVNPSPYNVVLRNSDNSFTKIGLVVSEVAQSKNHEFTILAQRAETLREALDGYFTSFNGTTSTVSFPFKGSIGSGLEYEIATFITYSCRFNRY